MTSDDTDADADADNDEEVDEDEDNAGTGRPDSGGDKSEAVARGRILAVIDRVKLGLAKFMPMPGVNMHRGARALNQVWRFSSLSELTRSSAPELGPRSLCSVPCINKAMTWWS